jgi:hypothetical protein
MKLGLGATVIVVLIGLVTGTDVSQLLGLLGGTTTGGGAEPPARTAPANDEASQFVSAVLGDTEDTWTELFRKDGKVYAKPRLVLFEEAVQSACGMNSSAVGPFYCPPDSKVYSNLAFFRDLAQRFQAPGDFAQAYVIAHEVGHHVQNLLGTSTRVHRERQRLSEVEANQQSVRLELQADCYAGVWGHHAHSQRKVLESGDVEEALGAAAAIGDDRLQKQARGSVAPESFTHGTSAQRTHWFRVGLTKGSIEACDTFRITEP